MPNSVLESIAPETLERGPLARDCERTEAARGLRSVVIELGVRNHPGAMSHITSLFARRAFNLEAIACAPVGDGSTSRMFLLVGNQPRLEQIERQLAKLYDVLSVRHREDIGPEYFARLVAI